MKQYLVKPKYNGTLNKTFKDPKDAIKYFYECNSPLVCGKMYGTIQDKLEELMWIDKIEIIEN